MKERKLVIEIDDNAIDSVIEKVRLLKHLAIFAKQDPHYPRLILPP